MNLEEIMGYTFKNTDLLVNSLVRADLVNLSLKFKDLKQYVHPTILENIGDSVLDLILRKRHYRVVRNKGELDKKRQDFTNNYRLTQFSLSIELEKVVFWSDNERSNTIWLKSNKVLADCFETIIGAIFLDSNLETVEKILLRLHFFNSS